MADSSTSSTWMDFIKTYAKEIIIVILIIIIIILLWKARSNSHDQELCDKCLEKVVNSKT